MSLQISKYPTLTTQQKYILLALWNREYPKQLALHDLTSLNRYLATLINTEHYLMHTEEETFAWAFTFSRDSSKWFAIIIDSKYQFRGLGTRLLKTLKENENELSGWVIDHALYRKSDGKRYSSPISFYLKNNFKVVDSCRIETPELSAVKVVWKNTETN